MTCIIELNHPPPYLPRIFVCRQHYGCPLRSAYVPHPGPRFFSVQSTQRGTKRARTKRMPHGPVLNVPADPLPALLSCPNRTTMESSLLCKQLPSDQSSRGGLGSFASRVLFCANSWLAIWSRPSCLHDTCPLPIPITSVRWRLFYCIDHNMQQQTWCQGKIK